MWGGWVRSGCEEEQLRSLPSSLMGASPMGEEGAVGECVREGTMRSMVGSLGVEALRNRRRLERRRFVSGVGLTGSMMNE